MAPHSRGVRLDELGRSRVEPAGKKHNTTSPPTYHRQIWFGLFPFRSPLLRKSLLISLPSPTKMLPFGEFPFPLFRWERPNGQEVLFGNPGIRGCLRLPRAYRRLPRPSSAPEPSHPPNGLVPLRSHP